MIKLLLTVLLISAGFTGFTQKDSVRKYLDAELHFTTKKDFVYAAMAIREQDHWVLYAVYPDTSILLKVFFKDAALSIKDGPFMLYHPKRVMAEMGNYKNNIADGLWQSWYGNGQLKNEGHIINNHFSGIWKTWYQNGLPLSEHNYIYTDTLEEPAAHQSIPAYKVEKVLDDFTADGKLDGPSTSWYENGNKESVVNYRNDSLTGLCTWFRLNGSLSSKEEYNGGKVTALECYDESGKYTGSTCSILKLPVLIHPVFDARDYIIDELHKEKHRDIREEGEVECSFTVTRKGTVENLVVLRSPDAALSKHIIQVFAGMPPWSPAVTHNRTVDYAMKLLIPYYNN